MDLQSYSAPPSSPSASLSLSLARNDLFRNTTLGIISPLGSASAGMGMPALPLSVMMDYYDHKAISPAVRRNYYDKVAETEKTAEADDAAPAKTAAETAAPSPEKSPVFEEGRGYDVEALERLYADMQKWHSDPKTAYRDYQPQAVGVDING